MAVLGLRLARNSLAPGWAPDAAAAHDALWTDAAAGYAWRPAAGGEANVAGDGHSAFASHRGSIAITAVRFAASGTLAGAAPGSAVVSLDWSNDGEAATLRLDRAWNTIKNAEIDAFSGRQLTLENWVDVWVHLANDFDQTVRIDGAKRGEISTGSGNDTIWIGADSNTMGWTNHFRIDSGDGDDTITITLASTDYSISAFAAAYNAHWTTTEIFSGRGNDTVYGGGGADTAWLGEGDDRFEGGGDNDWADGGDGFDVAIFDGLVADYRIEWTATGVMVSDLRASAPSGTDTLLNFELLQFADGTIALAAPNQPPLALADQYSLDAGGILAVGAGRGVLANDSDADGDPLLASLLSGPAHGTLALAADGAFIYVPEAGFVGLDSFVYAAVDTAGAAAEATVQLRVTAPNRPPTGQPDQYELSEDGTLQVSAASGVLANDTDPDGETLAALLAEGPTHGQLRLDGDGGFTYRPDADWHGTDHFAYYPADAVSFGAAVPVTITVRPVNDAPTARPDSFVLDEDTTLTVAAPGVLDNDSDIDGDALTVALDHGPGHGTLQWAGDGGFSYTPAPDWFGTDSFTYRISDGALSAAATVTLVVNNTDDGVTARDDFYASREDTTLNVPAAHGLLANDLGPDGGLSVAGGTFTTELGGTVVVRPDGSFTYHPAANVFGIDRFTYVMRDIDGDSAMATASIDVADVGEGPPATALADLIATHYATRFSGSAAADQAGTSIAGGRDVNGDGIPDFVIGAVGLDTPGRANSGGAYVVFGSADPAPAVGLGGLGSGGFRIIGARGSDSCGISVALIDDMNGDGRAEIAIGAPGYDVSGITNAGGVFVVFGTAGTAEVDLARIASGIGGFLIRGAATQDAAGYSVANAGDVNGDGRGDIVLGATLANAPGYDSGAAYVVFGKETGAMVNLAAMGNQGFVINGAAVNDQLGFAVAGVGDVNGDGRADIAIGARLSDLGGADSGAVFVVFGKATSSPVKLSSLGSGGFRITGADGDDLAGSSIAAAGDLNGDGLADLLLGAAGANPDGPGTGAAYVVYGRAGSAEVSLGTLGAGGFRISGEHEADLLGASVAALGDVNGDGFADLLLGAPGDDTAGPDAGAAYLLFGSAEGFGDVALSELTAGALRLVGPHAGAALGSAVAAAGDVNGDGLMDFLIGAPLANSPANAAGAVWLIHGQADWAW